MNRIAQNSRRKVALVNLGKQHLKYNAAIAMTDATGNKAASNYYISQCKRIEQEMVTLKTRIVG